MPKTNWKSRTKHDLIIEVWEALDCESVGARELEQLRQAVAERFGEGAIESPAVIARIVADEGAVLRHPEVLESDTRWRKATLNEIFPVPLSFQTLDEAAHSLHELDGLRRKLERQGDQGKLRRLREFAVESKQQARLLARSKTVALKQRLEAAEIAEWLTIWLQGPDLFQDWLSLRQRTPEYLALIDHNREP